MVLPRDTHNASAVYPLRDRQQYPLVRPAAPLRPTTDLSAAAVQQIQATEARWRIYQSQRTAPVVTAPSAGETFLSPAPQVAITPIAPPPAALPLLGPLETGAAPGGAWNGANDNPDNNYSSPGSTNPWTGGTTPDYPQAPSGMQSQYTPGGARIYKTRTGTAYYYPKQRGASGNSRMVNPDPWASPGSGAGQFGADQWVRGHWRNGRWINGYHRTRGDSDRTNNYSSQGQINPFTGRSGSR